MPTTMNCPDCQTPLRLRDDMAGKKIKCPRCGKIITVPAEEIVTLEEASAEDAITAEPPAAGPRKSRPRLGRVREDADEDYRPRRSEYVPCPRCGEEGAKRVVWTLWGSFYGPLLFTHVRCPGCGYKYNGRTGGSNLLPAIIFVTVPAFLILLILGFLAFVIYQATTAKV